MQYDYFFDDRLYAYGITSARSDFSTDLDLRWTVGPGFGYQIYDTEEFALATEIGLSYVNEEFGTGFEDDFAVLRLRYHLDWQVLENLEFDQDTNVNPRLDDFVDDVIASFDNRLNLKITGKLTLQLKYLLEFDGTPVPGTKQTDHTLTLGLGWTIG